MPTNTRILDDLSNIKKENYNKPLAVSLATNYNLSYRELPCIVFDDYNEYHQQFYISFAGMSEDILKSVFLDCVDIVKLATTPEKIPDITQLPQWREAVIRSIRTHLTKNAAVANSIKLSDKAFSLFELVRALTGT